MDYNIKEIFAARLRRARMTSGLSMEGLSKALGGLVSRQAINKYENAQMLPSNDVVCEMGRVLGVKYDYFFSGSDVTISEMSFRSETKISNKERSFISGKLQDMLERYLEAEMIMGENRLFTTTFFEMTIANEADAKVAAMRLHCDWALEDKPIYPLFDVMEDNGVKVVSCEFFPQSVKGVYCQVNGKPVVAINENLNAEESRFTALHELGHGLLRFKEGLSAIAREKLCDVFAGYVLLPADRLQEQLGRKREWVHLEEIKMVQARYGLPAEEIVKMARLENVISRYSYSRFITDVRDREDYSALVKASVMNEQKPSRMRSMILKAYGEAEISESKASVLLNTSITAVHQMPLV